MASPIQKFDERVSSASFVFLVYYRGNWCPFCMSYLKKLQSILVDVEAANGVIMAVTAELESENAQVRAASGFKGLIVNDQENVLAAELKRRNLLDVAITEKKGYPHGMAQPAVLVTRGENLVYQWAVVPSLMNFGGAKDRPLIDQVWLNVQSRMKGQSVASESIGKTSMMGLCREKLFG